MKFPLKKILTIDPGLHTAWMYWKGDLAPEFGMLTNARGATNAEEKLISVQKKMNNLLDTFVEQNKKIEKAYIEGTTYYHTARSFASATKGNLSLLSYCIGVCVCCLSNHGIDFEILEARQWKGNMSDEAVRYRVQYIMGRKFSNIHLYDAAGIGLSRVKGIWGLNQLKKQRNKRNRLKE